MAFGTKNRIHLVLRTFPKRIPLDVVILQGVEGRDTRDIMHKDKDSFRRLEGIAGVSFDDFA